MADLKPWEVEYEDPKPWEVSYESPTDEVKRNVLGESKEDLLAKAAIARTEGMAGNVVDKLINAGMTAAYYTPLRPQVASLMSLPQGVVERGTVPLVDKEKLRETVAPLTQSMGLTDPVTQGATDFATETASQLSTPQAIETMAAGPLGARIFQAQMIKDSPQALENLRQAASTGDIKETTKAALGAGMSLAAPLAIEKGLSPETKPATEVAQPEEIDATQKWQEPASSQPERPGVDTQRVSTETGGGDSAQPEAPPQPAQPQAGQAVREIPLTEAPKEATPESVIKMSADEFNKFAGTDATGKGYELAKSIGTEGDRSILDEGEKSAVAELKSEMQSLQKAGPEQMDKVFKDVQILNGKKQYFNEAKRMLEAMDEVKAGKSVAEAAKLKGVGEARLEDSVKTEQPAAPNPKIAELRSKAKDMRRRGVPGHAYELEYAANKLEQAQRGLQLKQPSPTMSEAGFVGLGVLEDLVNPIKDKLDDFKTSLSRVAAPFTTRASQDSANALVRYASAHQASPYLARTLTNDVLGPKRTDVAFRQRLGAVLVEDRLRAIKKSIDDQLSKATDPKEKSDLQNQSNRVTSLIGKNKPFADESDFQSALKDPEIVAAIQRHKDIVQKQATMFHTETGGKLAGTGIHTGAFVNLEALFDDVPGIVFGGGAKGDYSKPFKKGSVFGKSATGSAAKYELDYDRLAERMIRGNYEEFTKRQMYSQLEKDGLAKLLPVGEARPEIGDKPAVKFQVQRGRGETQNLWVRQDIAPEVRGALNLDGPIAHAAAAKIGNVLNKIQLAGPTDAVWHSANILSSISGQPGAKTMLADIVRKFPGVNIADASVRLGIKARKILQDSPEITKELSELGQIGATRPESLKQPGPMSRMISLLDKAGRLVRNDMYDNLAERGLLTPSESGRREFVNQLGQYNPRLMGQFQKFFKEAGLSPFIVAGRNFNAMAFRKMTLNPGFKAANMNSAVQMRALEGFGVLATLSVVPAIINTMTTGKPLGRPGVQYGQIDTGKDDGKGNHIVIDPAQWIGLRRGMRMTGANAIINGMLQHKAPSEIEKDAGKDIIGAVTHPWMGPAVQAPVIAATGYNTSRYKESENPNDYGQNVLAALRNLNPVAHAFFKSDKGGAIGNAAKSLSGAVGIKTAQNVSAFQDVGNRARAWGLDSSNPKIKSEFERRAKESFGESQYKPLKQSLVDGKPDEIVQSVRDLLSDESTDNGKQAKMKLILREFEPFNEKDIKPFATRSKEMELGFVKSLDNQGRRAYIDAVREQVEDYRRLTKALYGRAMNPPMPEKYRAQFGR